MDLTTLGLKKPLVTEAYDLQIVNDNADKVNELITADRTQINYLAPEAVKELTPLNGWLQGNPSLKYYKDGLKRVYVIGTISGGTATSGTIVAELPLGYRPLYETRGVFVKNNDATMATYIVYTNGQIEIMGLNSTGTIHFNFSFRTA